MTAYGEHYIQEFKTSFSCSTDADDNVSFLAVMLDDLLKKVNEIITQVNLDRHKKRNI